MVGIYPIITKLLKGGRKHTLMHYKLLQQKIKIFMAIYIWCIELGIYYL